MSMRINEMRYLATTADERSWKFDRPLLFLGEWCRVYERKHVWEGMDAVVAEPYGLKAGQTERDIAYVQDLSSQILTELVDALNTFHGVQHSERYWQIVLGHWLQRYVAVSFNRYATLEQTLNEHEISGTTMFEPGDYSLATTDSLTFIWACSDDLWNHVLYSKILKYWGQIKTDLTAEPLRGLFAFSLPKENSKKVGKTGTKQFLLNKAKRILVKLSRNRDAFIVNSYLPRKEEVKLQLAFGQCPQLWQSPLLETVAPVLEERLRFRIDAENHSGFERFVRCQLSEIIPSCYLEGYKHLVRQVESLPWPTKPRFIFTSNNFDTDEIFKAWTGSKVEKGILYFTGQHGNNYETLLGSQNWPELMSCDKFFTWGWSTGSLKIIPAFVFKLCGNKPQRWTTEGGLLLIELHSPHRLGPMDSYYNFAIYQEEQFLFVDELPWNIQQKLTVRLHNSYKSFRWSDEQRWKDRIPDANVETSNARLQDLIAQSRIVVHSYDSTGILETLAQNIPTLCFWHGGLTHLQESAKPYYEHLIQAGILYDSPESAAKKVVKVWDNIPEWWHSDRVQSARKIFCDRYARISNSPVSELKHILTVSSVNA